MTTRRVRPSREPRLPLSDSYLPPAIAGLPSLARMEDAKPIEFEKRVATAFEILGLEVQRLGQGHREPDGIAMCREHGWAVIYDAKARAGTYRILAPEERKFREYIERHAPNLRRDGMRRFYFAIVSSAFSEADLPKAGELCRVTEAKAVVMLEASALVKMVERHVGAPLSFTNQHLERALNETRIVGPTDIGARRLLNPVSSDPPPTPDMTADYPGGSSGMFMTLMGRWPDFEAKVKAFAEFFDYTLIHCLATPLRSSEGLDLTKPEDAALNGRREEAHRALGLMNHLTSNLEKDLSPRPQSVDEARKLIDRFRTLLVAPAMLSIEGLYQALFGRSSHPEEFSERLARLKAFKLDWESFARAANQHLGVEFFRPYVP